MPRDHLIETISLVKLQSLVVVYGVSGILLAIVTIAAVAVVVDYARMLYLRSKMPPGPLPWPIVGNTFSLPENKPWIYFEDLSKQYLSPVITFWIGRYEDARTSP